MLRAEKTLNTLGLKEKRCKITFIMKAIYQISQKPCLIRLEKKLMKFPQGSIFKYT